MNISNEQAMNISNEQKRNEFNQTEICISVFFPCSDYTMNL